MDVQDHRPARRRRPIFKGTTGAAVAALVLCVGLVGWMALSVLKQIDGMSSANSDNLQWSLSQAQVEFLRFQLALDEAERTGGSPEALMEMRRGFDVFYSRISTIERGPVFRSMRGTPGFDGPRDRVRAFLDDTVPLIDGSDDTLRAALPDISATAQAARDDVRAFSLAALIGFAELSDMRRQSLLGLMAWLAVVLVVIFAALALFAVSHFRLHRLSERRADMVETAGTRMRTIVQTSPHAIVVTDEVGTIREFNPAAERIFGHTRAEARGRNAIELLVPAEDQHRARQNELAFAEQRRRPQADERHFEIVLRGRDGHDFPAEFAIDRAEADQPIYVAHIRDISRRVRAEEELRAARDQALAGERAKSEFLAVMSHEMRTPLNGLLGTIQLMNDHQLTERQSDLLTRMRDSGQLLLGLVNDVLDLSKYESGKMKAENAPFELDRLLNGVVETARPVARSYGNSLDWQWVGPQPDHVMGDARRLRQVLLNLVGNAVKFTRNGVVEIEGECLAGDQVELRVIDNGIGIAEEDLERIFLDFETLDSSYAREAEGTGLGLGISRRLTTLMGGELGAESEPGEGSMFWIRVPLAPADAPQAEASETSDATDVAPAAPARAHEILLVEDNEVNRFIVREMLEAAGHVVVEAVNGREGVNCAALRRFDLILMDISMPVMDGTQATETIRGGGQASADVPIVALTAHALPEERERFQRIGMAACLSKPVDRDLLLRTIRELVDGGRAEDAPAPAAPKREGRLLDDGVLRMLVSRVPAAEVEKLVGRFLDETGEELLSLTEAEPDDPDLKAVAHKCAGSCGAFGAESMRLALARVETTIKLGDQPTPADLAALGPLWHESRKAIEDYIADAFTEAC
ncbi:ATP-binding protein [Marinibacterium sp. SX1]|uniref:hybrid sensor histidine kinase/response regulator n=1 Tax=Marinibacterium sp. SX1 TaxID=3388424 RepID=UPI003D1692A3